MAKVRIYFTDMSALTVPRPSPLPRRPLAIAASLLLHALALFALKAAQQQPAAAPQPLRVSMVPITLPPPDPPSRAASAKPAPAARSPRPAHAARAATAVETTARPARQGKATASAARAEPRLTIEGLRQQMRQLEPENANAKPLREDPEKARLARNINRAERADCAKAYANLGLLAAPMLLKDAFDKDNGCKW
ncbi:hypothetical protein [Chromobacterium subtsugae]|uniref:hypothetical protein n=1 Tax=Chromobacterium subtsugae TaxID=251747 RepID=UPI0012D4461E|nr:hypothetical protein [Chromobacterium subtsugae]